MDHLYRVTFSKGHTMNHSLSNLLYEVHHEPPILRSKRSLMALFHSTRCPVRLGPDARDGRPTPQKWSEKASSDRLRMLSRAPDCLAPRDKVSPTHEPIKWASSEYLAMMFTSFWSHTRIIGKGNLFDFAAILAGLTARSCSRQRGSL